MPGVVRKGDLGSGHDGHPGTISDECSDNVFVNGKGAVREGDKLIPHGHPREAKCCSKTVFVNGKGVVRLGDCIECEKKELSMFIESSDNVIAGG